jgi:hypothetical protein
MPSRTATLALIALCAVLFGAIVWQVNSHAAEKRIEEGRIAALSQELATAKKSAVPPPPVNPQPLREVKTPSEATAPILDANRQLTASVSKLTVDLASARAHIGELESKVLSLEADRAALTQQRQQELTASDESCRSRIADTQRSLESAQGDLKAAQQRAALFESENANLRRAQSQAAKTAPADSAAELEELWRRRDTYLKNLIRRYREIDTEYRSLLRDPQGAHSSDAAVFRLQSTLAQAEDDLHQIDSLNAKTMLVEKKRDKN